MGCEIIATGAKTKKKSNVNAIISFGIFNLRNGLDNKSVCVTEDEKMLDCAWEWREL